MHGALFKDTIKLSPSTMQILPVSLSHRGMHQPLAGVEALLLTSQNLHSTIDLTENNDQQLWAVCIYHYSHRRRVWHIN